MITHLSLFSGIGGLDLAAEWAGIKTVGQCEWADYPTRVLEKHWPDVPRWKNIRTLTGGSFYERTGRRTVDIISGGFPCQPFSLAGKRRGTEDDRYLWPEMVRVIKELRPTWVVGENVAGIVRMALPDILSELEACGYRARTFLVPACGVGARHRRYRVAIVAYSNSGGWLHGQNEINTTETREQAQRQSFQCCAGAGNMENSGCCGCGEQENVCEQLGRAEFERTSEDMAHAESWLARRLSIGAEQEKSRFGSGGEDVQHPNGTGRKEHESREWWSTESILGRVVDGIPCGMDGDLDFIINHYWDNEPDIPRIATGIEHRVDRLKCLGNAVVPQQFYPIFRAIVKITREDE